MFFDVINHLLPNAKAWTLTQSKNLRALFEGLAPFNDDIQQYFDEIYLDLFPATTRELDAWEKQWCLPSNITDDAERRARLDAVWKALGGQSPRYIQDTLRDAGFDVYVHEWWEEPLTDPVTVRNPLTYLDDGTAGAQYLMNDGTENAQDGDTISQDGSTAALPGFPLVNCQLVPQTFDALSDGEESMQDGDAVAMDGLGGIGYIDRQYIIPTDSDLWPFFIYIGGETFPDIASVPSSRRNEFETLCLKICPAQNWLGMLVQYT